MTLVSPVRPRLAEVLRRIADPEPADRLLLDGLVTRLAPCASQGVADRLIDELVSLQGVLTTARCDPLAVPADAGLVEGLALVHEVAERLTRPTVVRGECIGSTSALHAYVRVALAGRRREQVRVLYLDRRNRLLRDEQAAEGTVDHAPLYPREVMRRALQLSASALILVHNHPSGDPTPSQADIALTREVVAAGRALRIEVHDHLIVAGDRVTSFRALGLM